MSGTTVLLIDHDDDSRYVFSRMLRHRGYEVSEASDGKSGLQAAFTLPPDVLIVDLYTPVLDGCAVIEALQLYPATAHARTVVLTTDVRPEARKRAMLAGCGLFLVKPVSPTELVAAIEGKPSGARLALAR